MKEKLIIDTNYLIYLAKEKKFFVLENLFKIYDCYIVEKSFKEMEKIEKGKFKFRISLLKEILKKAIEEKKLKVVKGENVDKKILELAKKNFNVASFDKKLEKEIKKINKKAKIIKNFNEFF
jgi:rRNA-processing protein FCF1